jgi:hypothetical protein
MNKGRGVPARRTGMSKSFFRASDDATTLPFNIPANAMMTVALRRIYSLLLALGFTALAVNATRIAGEIDDGIRRYGIVNHPENGMGRVYAYEVDGFGSAYLMDDANLPSLLSLPYEGYLEKTDPIYLATRARILSSATNPWFFAGAAGEGVGGAHVGSNYIWPMSIIMRALTSTEDSEIKHCLELLGSTHADSFFIHESFHKDDQFDFTRRWFSWANSLFGELILTLAKERPHLIFKVNVVSVIQLDDLEIAYSTV